MAMAMTGPVWCYSGVYSEVYSEVYSGCTPYPGASSIPELEPRALA